MFPLALGTWLQAGGGQAPPPVRPDPQRPGPTFRVSANYVQVDVIVTDSQGRFIDDLRPEEFQLREDTKPQQIATFELINIPWAPARLLWPDPDAPPIESAAEPDVETNRGGFNGRVYLLVIDDLHINTARTSRARELARHFVERAVGPNDLAAVVSTSGRQHTAQEYTNSRRALAEAIDRVVGRKADSPSIVTLGTPRVGTNDPKSVMPDELLDPTTPALAKITEAPEAERTVRMQQMRASLDTLTQVAMHAAAIRGRRKAIVLIGEGFDYNLVDPLGTPREVRDLVQQMIEAANRANVSIYALDPRGITQGGDEAVDIVGIDHTLQEAWQKSGQTLRQDEGKVAKEGLQVFAEGTGGYAFIDQSTMKEAFDRIRTDNSTYYLLSYSPTNDRRDGKFRAIDVVVSRPGAMVRARKGYVEPKGKAATVAAPVAEVGGESSRVLRDALNNPLPVPGVTIAATAVPFRGSGPTASVLVLAHLSGQSVSFVPEGDKLRGSIELAVVAVDTQGKSRGGDRLEVTMPLGPEMQSLVVKAGMMLETRIDLAPGRYQLSVGARDQLTDRVGTVRYDFEVPDFSAAPLALSGLIVTSRLTGGVPTPRPDARASSLLGGTPVTGRVFEASDDLTVAAEVYDRQTAPHQVDMVTRVRTEGGRVVLRDEQRQTMDPAATAENTAGYVVQVPLGRLDPGTYVLTVEARAVQGQAPPASRDLRFTVRGDAR
jgi:VWFA-related protein